MVIIDLEVKIIRRVAVPAVHWSSIQLLFCFGTCKLSNLYLLRADDTFFRDMKYLKSSLTSVRGGKQGIGKVMAGWLTMVNQNCVWTQLKRIHKMWAKVIQEVPQHHADTFHHSNSGLDLKTDLPIFHLCEDMTTKTGKKTAHTTGPTRMHNNNRDSVMLCYVMSVRLY